MLAILLIVGIAVGTSETDKGVTAAEKRAFLILLAKLPHEGEFFTNDGIEKAVPYTRVLLALTKKDIEKNDLYSILALSQGLLNRKDQREYGVKHFASIAHPTIKLFWGAVLFNEKAASLEVVKFLRAALDSKEQSITLSEMLGPDFEDFKKRVREHRLKEKYEG